MTDEQLLKAALDALEDSRDTVWNEYHADWRNGLQPERSSVADLRRRAQDHDAVIVEIRKRIEGAA